MQMIVICSCEHWKNGSTRQTMMKAEELAEYQTEVWEEIVVVCGTTACYCCETLAHAVGM